MKIAARRRGRRQARGGLASGIALVVMTVVGTEATGQELAYNHGQSVSPAYEGWIEKPDGSRAFLFGYMNRNWVESPDVPVGPDNYFTVSESPGALDDLGVQAFDATQADVGQPTHFHPRRNRFVFEVPVPEGFQEEDEIVWTLRTRGEVRRAYATLRLDYFLDNVTIMSETGALGGGVSSPEIRDNLPPEVALEGPTQMTGRVGQPLTLSVLVTDDGMPPPGVLGVTDASARLDEVNPLHEDGTLDLERALRKPNYGTVGKTNGLHHSWFVYRQPPGATVRFDPPQIKTWEDVRPWSNSPWSDYWQPPALPDDDRWVARATFDTPGKYVLRGRADDGGLWRDVDVTVEVVP